MPIADDIIKRTLKLSQDRAFWARTWIDIAKLVIPTESIANAFNAIIAGIPPTQRMLGAGQTFPHSPQEVKNIYDNTGLWAVDRLAAGMESLVTPQSEKWHGLTVSDLLHGEPADEETQFLDRLRNFQFALRYDPRAGFIPAHQKAMRSCIAFGTGVVYTEESDDRSRMGESPCPIYYYYCSLAECLLGTNDRGHVDTNYRVVSFTARQLAQKFGIEKLSLRTRSMLDQQREDEYVTVIHAVCPREEIGSASMQKTTKGSPIASYYVEFDAKHMITDGGFFEFPFSVYHWLQQDNGPYAESPVMLALSEIKSLQAMGKSELRAFAQFTDPPLGVVNDGVMNRPNLNPRAVNVGAVGPDGSLRLKPILTAQNPDFAEKVMETRRMGVRETLYLNLFQILIKHPEMTATEAMLRANEKGELLGPAGGKIQSALSVLAERELGIYTRRGIFAQKGPNGQPGPFAPPQTLQGKTLAVKFTSPLDRLRRANEAIGITRLLEVVEPIAKVKPEVLDNLDIDDIVRQLREIYGAPASIIVPKSQVMQTRQQNAQKTAMQQQAPTIQTLADAARSGSTALSNVTDAAQGAPGAMDALSEVLNRARQGAGSPHAAQGNNPNINTILSQFGKPPVQPRAA